MKTFYCDACGGLVFFENVQCVKCGHILGFLPEVLDLSALEPVAGQANTFRALSKSAKDRNYHLCQNGRNHQICNWYVPVEDQNPFCLSCRMNKTIPDLAVAGNLERWHKMELAKRRLIHTLLRLGLPLEGDPQQNRPPLRFNFLADTGTQQILTGHEKGLITLNIAEADDAEREKRRVNFHEPYRTLLGHFRHENGHYYWDQLIANTPRLPRFRELFGDETQNYAAALQRHYQQGPPADWQNRCVSAYASSHPWEDWAETWAHYLHMVDTIETAAGVGMSLAPDHPDAKTMTADAKAVSDTDSSFDQILKNWLPLTSALNCLNRGMGLPDLYPFILSVPAIGKLRFIHKIIQEDRKKC